MAFIQALYSVNFHANCSNVEEKDYKIITENYRKVDVNASWKNVEFYRNKLSELISVFRNGNQFDLFVTAKNKIDFEKIINKFQLVWDYHSIQDE